MMAIAYDQSSGFHFSEVAPELGKGICSFRQSVGREDSLVKSDGREALDLVGGMDDRWIFQQIFYENFKCLWLGF
jgi:hypothetical protein